MIDASSCSNPCSDISYCNSTCCVSAGSSPLPCVGIVLCPVFFLKNKGPNSACESGCLLSCAFFFDLSFWGFPHLYFAGVRSFCFS
ncbi:hypothetical protein XELAEV_18024711mg [Xenopus laevis]|uniref:Uncharacterized protein n=1 Tax=Xenopus laevis TaxID=8355 RepID=A0A974D0T2_XENLA|nr:hypothetical protein XELAEV_18024711mg [Xenopus laevis]